MLRSFLQRAARQPGCREAAGQPAPTRGCVISGPALTAPFSWAVRSGAGYHCFLKRVPDYCATVSGRDVEWRLRPAATAANPR